MAKSCVALTLLLAASMAFLSTCARGDSSHKALKQAEFLALVAGNALPENLVREIGEDGLAFRPDDVFRSLLRKAGADPRVLKAMESARVAVANEKSGASDRDLLQHIGEAARLMNAKQFDAAAEELTEAITESFRSTECAFVMGDMLRRKGAWEKAGVMYQVVIDQDPSFPEAHTKLSYILYRDGDPDGALREARAAIAFDAEDPEAHKNAGLALASMKRTDAARAEYQEALRIKADYRAVHMDLGALFMHESAWSESAAEYRSAIALDASDADAFYNFGYASERMGKYDAAKDAYREARRLNPRRYESRQSSPPTQADQGQ